MAGSDRGSGLASRRAGGDAWCGLREGLRRAGDGLEWRRASMTLIRRVPPFCKAESAATRMGSEPRRQGAPRARTCCATASGCFRAARDVFAEGGAGASLEAVARRAGVGIGTLYRHFPTREALFQAVYSNEIDDLVELAEQLLAEAGPGGGPAALAARQRRRDRDQARHARRARSRPPTARRRSTRIRAAGCRGGRRR